MRTESLLGNFLQLLLDTFFGNSFRFVRHFRLPRGDRGKLDLRFVGTLSVLLIYGLVVLFSASYSTGYAKTGDLYQYIRPQLVVAVVGFVLMLALSNLNYRALQYAQWPLYLLTTILLVIALFSTPQNGHHRWIYPLGENSGLSLQPSELAKFSCILGVATYADLHYAKRKTLFHGIIGPLLPLLPYVVLLRLEPHNSAIILLALITFTMLICGGCGLRWMPVIVPVGAVGAAMMLLSKGNDVANQRLGAWGPLSVDISKVTDYQMKQSLYAIASGGLTGLGIGNGRQKHQWLPEGVNDFIFSVLCEELGFVGGVLCMLLFAFFIIQGILIALNAPDFFGTMLGIGITAQVAWQVFFHIGTVTSTTPNTGITLPFFSAGGTSLLLLLLEMGVLLSIARAGNARQTRLRQAAARAARREVYRRAAPTAGEQR